jgi:hypothetical protein
MATTSVLNANDVKFIGRLIKDIANEICDCKCCGERGTDIFERMWIASERIVSCATGTGGLWPFGNTYCIDWENICRRINTAANTNNRFSNPSRNKMMAGFYIQTYDIMSNGYVLADGYSTEALVADVFGDNAENVIENCTDECCR